MKNCINPPTPGAGAQQVPLLKAATFCHPLHFTSHLSAAPISSPLPASLAHPPRHQPNQLGFKRWNQCTPCCSHTALWCPPHLPPLARLPGPPPPPPPPLVTSQIRPIVRFLRGPKGGTSAPPPSPPPLPASLAHPRHASPPHHQPNQTNCEVFKGAQKVEPVHALLLPHCSLCPPPISPPLARLQPNQTSARTAPPPSPPPPPPWPTFYLLLPHWFSGAPPISPPLPASPCTPCCPTLVPPPSPPLARLPGPPPPSSPALLLHTASNPPQSPNGWNRCTLRCFRTALKSFPGTCQPQENPLGPAKSTLC